MNPSRPPLVVTPGDPRGVGPEVTVAALRQTGCPALVVGEASAVRREARRQGLDLRPWKSDERRSPEHPALWEPPASGEPVEVAAIRWAVDACRAGRAAALVTGPIHKGRLARRGFPHPGHTGFLGELCGVPEPVMAFVGRRMRVVLVTTHLPLRQVPGAITPERLLRVLRITAASFERDLGLEAPRLAVCGVNPHAGDDGIIGNEELEVVGPVCERARREGLHVGDPVSQEAAFQAMLRERVHGVVAMYHDQGLGPLKAVEFGRAVNWTLGLPLVRTSVDHGTADDIAGQGRADPGSMVAALELAWQVLRNRRGDVPPAAR